MVTAARHYLPDHRVRSIMEPLSFGVVASYLASSPARKRALSASRLSAAKSVRIPQQASRQAPLGLHNADLNSWPGTRGDTGGRGAGHRAGNRGR